MQQSHWTQVIGQISVGPYGMAVPWNMNATIKFALDYQVL